MKRVPLFWKIYLVVLATLFLPAFGIYWFDRWFETVRLYRAESEFEERRASLEIMTRELAEAFEKLADISLSDDNREVVLAWVRQKGLESGLDIYVSMNSMEYAEPAERFVVTVNDARVRIAPPLVASATTASGRTTLHSRLEPYEDWDELRTPLPRRLFFVMAIVGAAVSYLLVRNFMVPLGALNKAAEQVAGGNFSVRIDESITSGRDELRRLGAAFNVMTARVEKSLENQKRLLTDISHELRSPLQRLYLVFAMMEKKIKDRQADEFMLNQATHDIRHMDEMLEEMLSVARFEAAEELCLEKISLMELLASVSEAENFEWGKNRIELRGEDVSVNGDLKLLRRAVRNVIHNAACYSPAESKVEVLMSSEGGEAVIRVRDYGDGIAVEELENIFQPFYRTESARITIKGGSGLGLPMARRIMESHGGVCVAETAQGGGLLVILRLPL